MTAYLVVHPCRQSCPLCQCNTIGRSKFELAYPLAILNNSSWQLCKWGCLSCWRGTNINMVIPRITITCFFLIHSSLAYLLKQHVVVFERLLQGLDHLHEAKFSEAKGVMLVCRLANTFNASHFRMSFRCHVLMEVRGLNPKHLKSNSRHNFYQIAFELLHFIDFATL